MPPPLPLRPDEMLSRLEQALAASPAEATELVWIDARRGQESNGRRRQDSYEQQERTVLVRVRESGRLGLHRAGGGEVTDLENAVRTALAQARLSAPVPAPIAPSPPGAEAALAACGELHDPEVARLTPARAKEMIRSLAEREETVRLGWAEGRMAVANSRGLRRKAEMTSIWAAVHTGSGPGAGMAAAASRSLAGLDPSAVAARARGRAAVMMETAGLPEGPIPLALSPESVAALLELLNRRALTSTSFHQGTSPLRDAIGRPVIAPALTLRDDGTDAHGLPFPFDLLGAARRPIDLIAGGVFVTPALDEPLARAMGRPTTAHLVAPDEAAAAHLFLVPGEIPDEQLLAAIAAAGGGIWVSALDPLEGFDPTSLRFRAVARGVRRIEASGLGVPLPDLAWEDDLLTLLAGNVRAGSQPVTLALDDGLFGGITAPLLAFERVEGLRFTQRVL